MAETGETIPDIERNTSAQPDRTSLPETLKPLFSWISSLGGGFNPRVEFFTDTNKGHHARVKREGSPGTESIPLPSNSSIAKCPIKATISCLNLDPAVEGLPEHAFPKSKEFVEALRPEAAVAFFIMDQYLCGRKGFWEPYISSLPRPEEMGTTQFYDGEDLEWLEGTSLYSARMKRLESWKAKYDQGLRILRELGHNAADSYNWDLFRWASTIFTSRAFSSRVLTGFDRALSTLKGEEFQVLLPLVDLLNHQPLAKVEWQAGSDAVNLVVREETPAGGELHNNYGPRNSDQLMVSYGFCIPGNVCDYRTVTLNTSPGNPLHQAKTIHRQQFPHLYKEDTEDKYYVLNIFYPFIPPSRTIETSIFSPDLFDAVSIMSANDRELNHLQIEEDRIYVSSSEYGNTRSALAALSQMVIELMSHIKRMSVGGYLMKEPRNQKQKNAKIYRENQVMMSQQALVVSEWSLLRSRGGATNLDHYLARLPTERFGENAISRLKSLLNDRSSIVKHESELFLSQSVFGVLPANMQESVHGFVDSVTNLATKLGARPQASSFLVYAAFICLSVAVSRQNSELLLPKLQKWVPFLLETYPEPPTDQQWVLPDEEDESLLEQFDNAIEELHAEQPKIFQDMERCTGPWKGGEGWLSGNWLRWAWLVVEEEVVQIAEDPLVFVTGERAGDAHDLLARQLSLQYWLYIPA